MEDKNFIQIKKDLINRVESIEKYIKEGNEVREEVLRTLAKLNLKIYGDYDAEPPRLGIDKRLEVLERVEMTREQTKNGMLKIAVGSLTMAVGGAVIWVLTALRDAFIKPH